MSSENTYRYGVKIGNWVEEKNSKDATARLERTTVPSEERFSTTMHRSYAAPQPTEVEKHLGRDGIGKDNLFSHQQAGTVPQMRFDTTHKLDFVAKNTRPEPVPRDTASIAETLRTRAFAGKGFIRGLKTLATGAWANEWVSLNDLRAAFASSDLRAVFGDVSDESLVVLARAFEGNRTAANQNNNINNNNSKNGNAAPNVNLYALLTFLRGALPPRRERIFARCWDKIANGEEIVSVLQLEKAYSPKGEEAFKNGSKTKFDLFQELVDALDLKRDDPDQLLHRGDLESYYIMISAKIPEDAHFELLLRNSWNI